MLRKILLSALLLLSFSSIAAEAQDVVAVKSFNLRQYDEVLAGFKSVCDCSVRVFTLSEVDGSEVLNRIDRIKPPVVFAIGAEALSLVSKTDRQIVYSMVFYPQQIISKKENISGINIHISFERQLEEFHKALPKVRRLGLVYDPGKTPSVKINEAVLAAKKNEIVLVLREVSSPQRVLTAINNLKDKVDAFWMLPDSTVVTPETVELILLSSIENRIPILTFSSKYVEMGALLSLSQDTFDMGRRAGTLAKSIISGEAAGSLPEGIVLSINLKAAKNLGITLDDTVVKRARIVNK